MNKKILDAVIFFLLGVAISTTYIAYTENQQKTQLYGSRDVAQEVKHNVERANLVLDTVEKKYIKKEPVTPPKPLITCTCNGTGLVLQPDGNRSQCPCSSNPAGCTCKPKTEPQP